MRINIYVHVFVTALLLQADGEIIRQYFLHFLTDVFQWANPRLLISHIGLRKVSMKDFYF